MVALHSFPTTVISISFKRKPSERLKLIENEDVGDIIRLVLSVEDLYLLMGCVQNARVALSPRRFRAVFGDLDESREMLLVSWMDQNDKIRRPHP